MFSFASVSCLMSSINLRCVSCTINLSFLKDSYTADDTALDMRCSISTSFFWFQEFFSCSCLVINSFLVSSTAVVTASWCDCSSSLAVCSCLFFSKVSLLFKSESISRRHFCNASTRSTSTVRNASSRSFLAWAVTVCNAVLN